MRLVALASLLLPLSLGACGQGSTAPDGGMASPQVSATDEVAKPKIAADAPVILAFGDSLYAGYQLDPDASYPAKLEAALAKKGASARVINAGVSGDTTADGLQRLAFTLDNQPVKPTLVMVGLGGNDMLRALPPAQTRANLDAILAELKRRKLPVLITGMLAAPNLGADYVRDFNPIFPALARKYGATLVPFLLQPVIGHPEWQLPDHVHPNATGVDKVVDSSVDKIAEALATARGKAAG